MAVEKGDALGDILEAAFGREGPVLVDCPVDSTENRELDRDLAREIRHLVEKKELP